MAFSEVEAAIDRIDNADAGAPRKRITILGAGIAGLVAAYELSRLGHDVRVIEAQDRVGGRIWTHRFGNGDYHELGAMRIPKLHSYTRYYLARFNLSLRPFINHHNDPDTFYSFRGITASHASYKTKLLPLFNLGSGDLERIQGGDLPAVALLSAFGHAVEEVKNDPQSRRALFGEGPMTELVEKLDAQTLYDYLKEHLETEDAIELAGMASGLEVWWDKAASMLIREELAMEDNTGLDEVVGGTDLLPSALYQELARRNNVDVLLNTRVRAVHNQGRTVQLVLATKKNAEEPWDDNERIERVDADHVVCTIPFGVMRRLGLSGFSSEKMRAIRNLSYASSAKVLFSCEERFWESNYQIFGGGSQLDLVNRQIYYPSECASTPQQAPEALCNVHSSFAAPSAEKTPPSRSTAGSGPLVGSYVWGADARRLGAVSHEERVRTVMKCVAEIHPEILSDGMVRESASIFWDEFDWSAGAFCFMRPGDLRLHYQDVIRTEGRVYFAGEHCSMDQAWIQGAISSSLRAVTELVGVRD